MRLRNVVVFAAASLSVLFVSSAQAQYWGGPIVAPGPPLMTVGGPAYFTPGVTVVRPAPMIVRRQAVLTPTVVYGAPATVITPVPMMVAPASPLYNGGWGWTPAMGYGIGPRPRGWWGW